MGKKKKPTKWNIELVKKEFKKKNYTLLEREYINQKTKMKYTCGIHTKNIQYCSLNNLLATKNTCIYCREKIDKERKEKEYNNVKKLFKKKNYTLLEEEYKRIDTKMKYICNSHPEHIRTITVNSLKNGKGCKECFRDRQRTDFEKVKKLFESKNCTLLEEKFINGNTKMRYICNLHPKEVQFVEFRSFKVNKHSCSFCYLETRRTNFEIVKKEFEKAEYELLINEEEYINGEIPLEFNCPKHYEKKTTISYFNLKKGHKCIYCFYDSIKGENHHNWNKNLTDEDRILGKKRRRDTDEYREWRTQVYERDNYTCQCCGDNRGGRFNAHHKDGWHWCKERRYDVTNGVTLCVTCHKDFHFKYGRRNNTEEQFNQWLKNNIEFKNSDERVS